MIAIYTKHPEKGVDFLIKVCERLRIDGDSKAKVVKTKSGYFSRLYGLNEYWEVLPIDNRVRGKKWKKCYVDLDISKNDLLNIVLTNKDPFSERWERPMIFI